MKKDFDISERYIMKLLLVDNAHIYKTSKGRYYSPSIYGNEFFERYLKVFETIRFVSKVKYISEDEVKGMLEITNPNIDFFAIPWYQGSQQLLHRIIPVVLAYRRAASGCDCSILRIAQIESFFTYAFSNCRRKPFAVELVNDPIEFKDLPLLVRKLVVSLTRKLLSEAVGASYVTKYFLQRKYPCKSVDDGIGFSSYYSSITLFNDDIALVGKTITKDELCLIHVSNAINSNSKGHFEVMQIVSSLCAMGINTKVVFIGDGSAVPDFKNYASKLRIEERVNFVGRIASHAEVMNKLSEADVFVFPTKLGEGLPRVVIEAMAKGLPCFVAPAGGVDELVDDYFIIPSDKIDEYVIKIRELWLDKERFNKESLENIAVARTFTKDVLDKRRVHFYEALNQMTQTNTR